MKTIIISIMLLAAIPAAADTFNEGGSGGVILNRPAFVMEPGDGRISSCLLEWV